MLNIYKISGVGAIRDNGKYKVWTADTVEPENTVAFNYLLSEVNVLCAESDVTADKAKEAEILNNVDLYIICLEALTYYQSDKDKYPLEYLGLVISEMVADNLFVADFVDDERRADNLDILINEFESRLNENLTGESDEQFNEWWSSNIVAYDYNYVTPEQLERYKKIISEKVGRTADGDPETMAEFVADAGPAFLYMFIPDNEVDKYNSIIRYRRKIEIDRNRKWVVRNMGAAYNKQTIDNYLRAGVIAEYNMTPEEKLQEVFDNGGALFGKNEKVGDFGISAILTIISIAIAALGILLDFIVNMYAVSVQKPTGYENGVPDEEVDLNAAFGNEQAAFTTDDKWLLLGGAAAVLAILMS